jgi:membrane-associated protein
MTGVVMRFGILGHRRLASISHVDNHRGGALSGRHAAVTDGCATIGRVRRPATAVTALLLPALLHIHHPLHGSPLDYLGLAAAAAASWVGVPGPGEPVLIGAGVLASKGRLDLASVLVVAWLGATVGGIIGWVIGRKAGRRVLTARGPLLAQRLRAVERGENVFERYAVIAIVLTPSWIAGIHRVRSSVYQPTNAAAAAVWACGIGVGSYLAGPSVIDFVNDFGTGMTAVVAAVLVCGVGLELARRHRLRSRPQR